MPSKLTFHISGFTGNVFDLVERMQPSLVKVFDFPSDTNIDEIRRRCPRTLIVYRQYVPMTPEREWSFHDPVEGFVAHIGDALDKLKGRGIVWEGVNEPVLASEQDAQALNAWFVKFAGLLHARGEKVAAFSFSTGNPNLNFVPLLAPAAAACDYLAMHEYYYPNGGGADLARYRVFRAKLPANAQKQILITECGVDNGGGVGDGWHNFKSADEYMAILRDYDKQLMQDAYVVGGTIFQYGAGGKWESFDVAGIGARIADYVANAGGGAPIGTGAPISSGTTAGGATTTPPVVTPPVVKPPVVTPGGATTTYTVQAGDTLFKIAQAFGVTVAAMVTANNIANPSLIKPGQVLTIPPKS